MYPFPWVWFFVLSAVPFPVFRKSRPVSPDLCRQEPPGAAAAGGDSLDWKDYDAPTILERVTSRVSPGSIILFHNAALHTPEALPAILEQLIGEGYEIVPVSRLILPGECTIDHTGRQCPAA